MQNGHCFSSSQRPAVSNNYKKIKELTHCDLNGQIELPKVIKTPLQKKQGQLRPGGQRRLALHGGQTQQLKKLPQTESKQRLVQVVKGRIVAQNLINKLKDPKRHLSPPRTSQTSGTR